MPQAELPFPGDEPGVGPAFDDALRALRDRDFCQSQKFQEQQWRAVRTTKDGGGVYPDLLEFERVFIKRMRALGVPMFCAEAIRSAERQNELFALGVSKARAGLGAHEFGLAVDIVHGTKAWNLTKRQWALVGHVGKEAARSVGFLVDDDKARNASVRLIWGGDWGFYDPAHWEVGNFHNIKGGFPKWGKP